MPFFHAHGCGGNYREGSIVALSERPGAYALHRSPAPIVGFVDLPMTSYVYCSTREFTKEELCDYFASKDTNYFEICVYGNYDGGLDLYLRNGRHGSWPYYTLTMPADLPYGREVSVDYPYPRPTDWPYALRKNFVRRAMEHDSEDEEFVVDIDLFGD